MKLEQQLLENQIFPLAASSDLVVQEFKDEVLIYNLRTNRAFCLNATSAAVWQACDGNRGVLEIADEVSRKLNTFVNEDIVWLALEQLKKDSLLVDSEDLLINFGGMSRRDMIRKAGLATMVALPLVSSLVAPPAAAAQSASIACTTPTTSLLSLGVLALLNVGAVAPFQCTSSTDCCPPAPGCFLAGNACVEITIGNGTPLLPTVDVNVCLDTGFVCNQ